ncbi:MAG: hypothetical protein FWD06_05975 [Oscillospiraceae bacterium]|nr:hypothetical protein [Oscillospiraceae bacterium]
MPISPQGEAFVEEVDHLADEVWDDNTVTLAMAVVPGEKKARNIKRLANALFGFGVLVCLLLTVVLVLNTFPGGVFGLRFFVEPTDAMAPVIARGDMLITVNRAPERIDSGNVITYYALPGQPDSRLTRVVHERAGSGARLYFRTRRPEAGVEHDSLEIPAAQVLGVRVAVIPRAGFVLSFLHTHAWAIAVLAAALCVAAVLLRKWVRPFVRKKKVIVHEEQALF